MSTALTARVQKTMDAINKATGHQMVGFCSAVGGPTIETFSSGSLCLDLALGKGGHPYGRHIEIFGPSMAGKTTVAFLAMAEVQREGKGLVAFVDAEHAFNPELAASYGVDLDALLYVNPKTAENAVDAIDALIRSGDVRLIVVDSVAAMVPTKIVESSASQQTMALLARFMSTTMQKLTGVAYEHDCAVIWINQLRNSMAMYGN
jgi:recombination protein RecA